MKHPSRERHNIFIHIIIQTYTHTAFFDFSQKNTILLPSLSLTTNKHSLRLISKERDRKKRESIIIVEREDRKEKENNLYV
jgi:hypothetical protein